MPYRNLKDLMVAIEERLPNGAPKFSERLPVVPDFLVELPDLPAPAKLPEMAAPSAGAGLKHYVTQVEIMPAAAEVASTPAAPPPLSGLPDEPGVADIGLEAIQDIKQDSPFVEVVPRGKRKRKALAGGELVREFVEDRAFRGCTQRTLTNYSNVLTRFLDGSGQVIPTDPAAVRRFLAPFKGSTKETYWRYLSGFYGFLETEYGFASPMPRVPKPPRGKRLPSHLNPEHKRLLEETELNPRDRAVIRLFAECAVRPGEVAGDRGHALRFCDIYEDNILVSGKTGDRAVPIMPQLRDVLLALQDGRPADSPVFLGHKGPLTTWGLRKVVRKAFRAASITGVKASPYTLRHSFGGDFLARGGDLATLQKILGHANVKTTMIYTHIADKAVFDAYRKYGPGARAVNHP